MGTDEVNEKVAKTMVVVNVVLWIVGIFFFFKGARWLGGSWYHWLLSLFLVGFAKTILSAFIKVVVKVAMEQKAK